MKATLIARHDLTDTITSFSFEPAQPFTFTAGQFIELTLIGHSDHEQPARRWFTLSSSPHESQLTITTKVPPKTPSAFKRALRTMKVGALVEISEPLGDFVLPKLLQTPIVFVAGGIGITPFRSMLEWLAYTDEQRVIRLLYSVKNEDEIIFQDTFDSAKQHATIVVSEPSAAWGGERGQLTAEMILGLEQPSDETLIYISGPGPFVQLMQRDLRRLGIAHQQIVLDEFQGYTDL